MSKNSKIAVRYALRNVFRVIPAKFEGSSSKGVGVDSFLVNFQKFALEVFEVIDSYLIAWTSHYEKVHNSKNILNFLILKKACKREINFLQHKPQFELGKIFSLDPPCGLNGTRAQIQRR